MQRLLLPLVVLGLGAGVAPAAEPAESAANVVSVDGVAADAVTAGRVDLTVDTPAIPEPTSMALYAAGAVGLLMRRYRSGAKA